MGHFAKIIEGKVIQVIVAQPEYFETFVDTSPGIYVQCSYNTRGGVYYLPDSDTPDPDQSKALRKNYPGIGWTYDSELDAFYEPQPYPSWTLNRETCLWEAPVARPNVDLNTCNCNCIWLEDSQSWIIDEFDVE
jgi:hypothetical protein